MIKKVNVNGDMEALVSAIQNSGFLRTETVSYDSDTKTLSIKDAFDNVLFTLVTSGTSDSVLTWTVYASESDSASGNLGGASGGGDPYVGYVRNLFSCKGGLIIEVHRMGYSTSSFTLPIRVLRTNLGKLAFLFSSNNSADGSASSQYTNQHCIAWGDVKTNDEFVPITLGQAVRQAAIVAPLFTNGQFSAISFTATGGWLTYFNDRSQDLRAIEINGHHFITDGTVAIEDVIG